MLAVKHLLKVKTEVPSHSKTILMVKLRLQHHKYQLNNCKCNKSNTNNNNNSYKLNLLIWLPCRFNKASKLTTMVVDKKKVAMMWIINKLMLYNMQASCKEVWGWLELLVVTIMNKPAIETIQAIISLCSSNTTITTMVVVLDNNRLISRCNSLRPILMDSSKINNSINMRSDGYFKIQKNKACLFY